MLLAKDEIRVFPNVKVELLYENGETEVVETHNVFTNAGRKWLAECNRALSGGSRKLNTIPYYLAVGKGSDRQTISPPGAGAQTESASVEYIENPVEVTSGVYLKAFDRPTTEPSDYINRYEVTLLSSDVTFGSYTSVPLTEFGIITSDAVTSSPGGKKSASGGPYSGTYDNGRLIAYAAIPPHSKTSLWSLRVSWDLRF